MCLVMVAALQAAAAVRFAAATALATFLSSPAGPPPADVLLAAVAASTPTAQQQQQPGKKREKGVLLLPLLSQLLDEDWYADVRHTGCFIAQQLLSQVRLYSRVSTLEPTQHCITSKLLPCHSELGFKVLDLELCQCPGIHGVLWRLLMEPIEG
jgi:hypothetical protein